MTRTSAEVIADARSTREAEAALALRRDELGEAGYLQAMRGLLGPERYVDWIEGMYLGRYGRGSSRCGGAEKGQQMAAAKKQRSAPMSFDFRGRMVTVDSKAPKEKSDYSGRKWMEGGALMLLVEVPRPQLPEPPKKQYPLTTKRPDVWTEPAAFVEPAKKDGESDAAFKKRRDEDRKAHGQRVSSWKNASSQAVAWDEALAKHNAAVAKHQREIERVAAEFQQYAQMAGVGALIQGLPVRLTLTPDPTAMGKYLPGFSPVALLGAGSPAGLLEGNAEDAEDAEGAEEAAG